jgi:DNA-binding Xre family transcriptional regulator
MILSKRGMTPKTAENLRVQKGIDKGTKIRRLRVQKGLSQSELASVSGVPLKTLQRYEQTKLPVDNAKLKTLVALCLALDCKIEDIIESEELLHKYRATK